MQERERERRSNLKKGEGFREDILDKERKGKVRHNRGSRSFR